jgi:cytochrome c553
MTRRAWLRALALGLIALGGTGALVTRAASPSGRAQAPPPAPSLERQLNMQHHFAEVERIHDAIVRGDLPAVRPPATELSRMAVPPGTLPIAVPYVLAISEEAKAVLAANDLARAARAAASMLRQCGECHQAAKVSPLRPAPPAALAGGLTGHMLEHQRAVDELLQGLVVPSASQWARGAERLRTAPLRPAELPQDPGLAGSVRRADERVHQIAGRAAVAETPAARANVYADLLTTCADCHSLHRRIWGPKSN